MITSYRIEFNEVMSPLNAPVTKFGGQPYWLGDPQWPLSRETGQPMRFICQVCIPKDLVSSPDHIAYIFMTDGDEYVDGTWEPDGGENAVVIQPNGGPLLVDCAATAVGPTLYRMVDRPAERRRIPQSCEFEVSLQKSNEPDFIPQETRLDLSDIDTREYYDALEGNKVGGTPMFIQADEFPEGGPWDLLLQLDSTSVPFDVNFGDAGIGYAFVSGDRAMGRFLWQCG
jgi:uncharacterized protein YwqG